LSSEEATEQAEDETPEELAKVYKNIRSILDGSKAIKLNLEFLYRNNHTDLSILNKVRDSLEGRNQLGIALMEARRFGLAEASLRRVLDYHRSVQVFEPVVSASQLNLARLLDLMGRRSEALLEYQRVLALPDEGDAHTVARAGMIEPYVLPARVAGPSQATLLRYVGEYRSPQGIALSVSVDALDVMQLRPALPGRSGLLEWIEGARFRPAGSSDSMLEFSDEPQARTLTLNVGGRVIELQRQE
jgi:tetratricopeptide (TPR) repeat protein